MLNIISSPKPPMLVYMLYTSGIERVAVPVQKPNPGRYLACLGGIRRKSWLGGWRLRVRGRLEGSSVAKYIDCGVLMLVARVMDRAVYIRM